MAQHSITFLRHPVQVFYARRTVSFLHLLYSDNFAAEGLPATHIGIPQRGNIY
ncbi:Hypothetical protein AKI40_4724 [Enterobacter sp. FY-07]|nr:Hypothetical protein AKI40_4724 [Enterobacter sp. FY-07]